MSQCQRFQTVLGLALMGNNSLKTSVQLSLQKIIKNYPVDNSQVVEKLGLFVTAVANL